MKRYLIAIMLLAACDVPAEQSPAPVYSSKSSTKVGGWLELGGYTRETKVVRIEYPDAICFVVDGYKSGGISCYPKYPGAGK